MNKLERYIYNKIKSNPKIKFFVRNLYQTFYDLLPDKKNYFIEDPIVLEGYFFGFHDISPFSANEQLLLSNKLEIPLKMPSKVDPLSIGFFKDHFKAYEKIDETKAWNYHKGCRLQWIDYNNKFIYNYFQEELISKIFNIQENRFNNLDFPIDSISPDGKLASNFSYERLEKFMPGYGYLYYDNGLTDKSAPSDTGLFIINVENNTKKLLISLKDLVHINSNKTMGNNWHFVTHSSFSPDNKHIAFLHRWVENDIRKRYTRLVVVSLDKNEIYISPTNGMVSHYVWNKKGEIIAYCRINDIDSHVLFKNFTLKEYQRIAYPIINSDGHQHFDDSGDFFITDTYPDKRRYSKLFMVDINKNIITKLVEIKSPKSFQSPSPFKHWACDLHPRWSKNNNFICFDSSHTGTRSICVMKINKEKLYS